MRTLLLLSCLALGGCLSGLGEGDGTPIRFFSAQPDPDPKGVTASEGLELRVRHVTAARHLSDRMVWRASDAEFGFYESRRWTELPVRWVEAALVQELREGHGVMKTDGLSALILDVHLIGFEERLDPHSAEVSIQVAVSRPGAETLLDRRITRHVSIEEDSGDAVARATRMALSEAVQQAAGEIVRALGTDG